MAALKKERWTLYMRLAAPYLCADPRPELVDVWTRISQIKLAAVSKHCEDGVCSSKIAILEDILGGTLWVKPERSSAYHEDT